MNIGFTGTSKGMTPRQKVTFRRVLSEALDELKSSKFEFHHGDCVGADAEAHDITYLLQYFFIVLHPPINQSKRAFKHGDLTLKAFPYLDRNKHIVADTDRLIATPAQKEEQLRSGTWSTVRYARKAGKPVTIIYPDGTIA